MEDVQKPHLAGQQKGGGLEEGLKIRQEGPFATSIRSPVSQDHQLTVSTWAESPNA